MRQPKLLTNSWAEKGLKNEIPLVREGSEVSSATATYEDGFPDITMKPINEGGKAPSGKDMNGILHEITAHIKYQNMGGFYAFEADFAQAIEGYPKGSILKDDAGNALFISLIDGNFCNFNREAYEGFWEVLTILGLNKPDGFKYVGQCESIAELRTIEPTTDKQRILVKSYYAGGTTGGGEFQSDFTDTTTADNGGTVIVTAEGKRWVRLSNHLTVFDFGAKTDADSTDAINRLEQSGFAANGLGAVIPVNSKRLPAAQISNVAYKYDGIEYLSSDFYKGECSQITRTGHYTAWTQNKAFVHDNVIYAPFMLAFRHGYDNLRVAWVKSYDDGETWTSPQILLDYHPQNPTLGWHSFSMGETSNRLFMFVEERNVSTNGTNNAFLYSRPMTQTRHLTGGISQNGNVVTVNVPNHGLFIGDEVSFSNVDVTGISGHKQVANIIDAHHFTIINTISQTVTVTKDWRLGISFEKNSWNIQEIGTFNSTDGNPLTHIHSYSTVSDNQFLAGFHNGGSSPREVGFLNVQIQWHNSNVQLTKVKLSDTTANYAGEPTVRYYNDKVYVTTRSQSARTRPLFVRCNLDGSGEESFSLSGAHYGSYSPMPFVMHNDTAYIFSTERGEGEWETSDLSGRLSVNYPRTFLYTLKLSDFGNVDKIRCQCVYQGIYAGEHSATACGVGSALYHRGQLFYLFGDEDYRNSHSLVENASKAYNPYVDNGFQPEIYSLRLTIEAKQSGIDGRNLRGADNLHLPVFRGIDDVREVQSPIRFAGHTDVLDLSATQATVLNLIAEKVLKLIVGNAKQDYAVVGTDYINDIKQLYLSSTESPSTKNGAIIVLHNDKSTTPNQIDYKGETHVFTGDLLGRTPTADAEGGEITTAAWVRRMIKKESLIWSGNSSESVTVDVMTNSGLLMVLITNRGKDIWHAVSIANCNGTYIGTSEFGGENADKNYSSYLAITRSGTNITLTPAPTLVSRDPVYLKKVILMGA